MTTEQSQPIEVVFFDFSGVLADEGFVDGLRKIAVRNGFDPDEFQAVATEICYEGGYATGKASEAEFWEELRKKTGLVEQVEMLHMEIMAGFNVRLWMLEVVDAIRASGVKTAILSDHTNWLEALDFELSIYSHFDRVFNSYREGISKRSHDYFHHALRAMDVKPERALFVDDNPSNLLRAGEIGMQTLLYDEHEKVLERLQSLFPSVKFPMA
ncbi:HAD family hydrolase [Halodesulfovibrio marinisediminis]|uniref:Putative hydrolase of the HAD superfamily n=1 Tax=Halodesulfovibrio marinisediminis DSM 17456 TaxID=1121457 RepID=A0A1N6FG94_9BACT|nr:HAD family phosphatase [Halodesulfovibrio marinisediminis]SIN94303.1 putative hydrolase of the HAD superfamily [Halodesulfovibrio marinisediminis DSM 17456]